MIDGFNFSPISTIESLGIIRMCVLPHIPEVSSCKGQGHRIQSIYKIKFDAFVLNPSTVTYFIVQDLS
jgi:hypothetical protein